MLAAAVPPGLMTVAGFLGSRFWIADPAAAYRPQLAVVLGGLGVAAVVRGRRRGALAVAALALVNAGLVAPVYVGSTASAASEATLRVHFHNVHAGGDARFAQIVDALRRSDADVVILGQTSPRWVELFQAVDLPHTLVHPLTWDDHRRVIVLSRVPVARVEPIELIEDARSGAIAFDVALDGRSVRILGVHTQSPRTAARAAERDAELAAVGDWVLAHDVPTVVIGDLNATPWSHALRGLLRRTDLVDSMVGHGLQPSWPARRGPLMVPIDHALHDPALTAVHRSTGADLGSAHRSLTVDLAWRTDGVSGRAR